MVKKSVSFLLLVLSCLWLIAQTNISGVINNYTPVTAITQSGCNTQLSVTFAAGFGVGDKVMLMQMKGAVIDSANNSTFGDILNLNGAGNYEFSRIQSISGNTFTLTTNLVNSYYLNGFVQLIRVPEYTDANVTGTLTAQGFNGSVGGVLVFSVSNTLTLNADIDVSGLGFVGGYISNNPDGSCGSGSPGYYYPLTQPGGSWTSGGAMKGESITLLNNDRMAGRGKLASGGGGGNKHNLGGGGGAGFTDGGHGGEVLQGCPINGYYGIGGKGLGSLIATNKLFLGGGGGCGDYNNGVGSNGADGGGIIIIQAGIVVANGHVIKANGADETVVGTGIADGVGGGGGGGLIFLNVANYTGALSLEVNGGYGGNQDPNYGCVGTGGGGGAGAVLTSQGSLPGNVSISSMAGVAGIFLNSNFSGCAGTSYYATAGVNNTSGPVTNLPFVQGTGGGTLSAVLGNDTSLCIGNSLVLNPNISGGTYLWQDGSTNPTYTVTANGTYWVQVSAAGCNGGDTIDVSFVAPPVVNLGNDTTLCNNATLLLNAGSGATAYQWQDGSTNQTYTVTTAGTYSVTAANGGCTATDAINVAYNNVQFNLGNDTTLCTGKTLTLNPAANSAVYTWQDGSSANTYVVSAAGNYAVTATSGNCSYSDNINAAYTNPPVVDLGNDTTICSGNAIVKNVSTAGATYLWNDGSTLPSKTINDAGNYRVTVSLGGCAGTDDIAVYELDSPRISLGKDGILCEGQTMLLNAAWPGATYLWQDNSTDPAYTIKEGGTYFVQVSNICGSLVDTVVFTQNACDCQVYVPTAFTPNGDGLNDRFRATVRCKLTNFNLRVFNRWGELVFETNNPDDGWDGSYKGVLQPVGVYVYFIEYTGYEGEELHKFSASGNVTYIR